jgi:hypothetical protein
MDTAPVRELSMPQERRNPGPEEAGPRGLGQSVQVFSLAAQHPA